MAQRSGGVVEVVVSWGDEVLDVSHVRPRREARTDRGVLGAPIVLEREGALWCAIPAGAHAQLTTRGAQRLIEAPMVELAESEVVQIEHGCLVFTLRRTDAAAPPPRGPRASRSRAAWLGVSFAVHAAMVTIFWLMPPRTFARPPVYTGVMPPVGIGVADELAATSTAGTGERHLEREGALGAREERRTRGRFAVRARDDDPSPRLARDRGRGSMRSIGAIGAVRAMLGDWDAPTSPYGAARANGSDASAALGAMMAERVGDAEGWGGLGMRGTGRGGGGTGRGTIGLGTLGTIGYGSSCSACSGGGAGYGARQGGGLRSRESRAPRVHCGGGGSDGGGCSALIMGSLSREAIRRVVRSHLAEIRFCYEQGLAHNPSLEGRVSVQWIIGPDGRVASAALASSDVSSANVEQCIVGAVRRWSFPAQPDGSTTGVTYPFVLRSS